MPIEGPSGSVPRITKWYNPCLVARKVRICMEGTWRTVRWEPGETIELPSTYDRAIQIVICQEDSCNGRGQGAIKCQPCVRGHYGQIMGGQDPLLVRVGGEDIRNPSLDPDEVTRQENDKQAKQFVAQQEAMTAALIKAQAAVATATVAAQKSKGKPADSQ